MSSLDSAAGATRTNMGGLVVDGLALVGVEVPVKDGVEGGMGKEGVADVGGCVADEFGTCNSGEVGGVCVFHQCAPGVVVAEEDGDDLFGGREASGCWLALGDIPEVPANF